MKAVTEAGEVVAIKRIKKAWLPCTPPSHCDSLLNASHPVAVGPECVRGFLPLLSPVPRPPAAAVSHLGGLPWSAGGPKPDEAPARKHRSVGVCKTLTKAPSWLAKPSLR